MAVMNVSFPRMTIDNESDTNKLHVFCDGSKGCYGFSCYISDGNLSQLVFAKGKVTPKGKSVPQIELLSVFLAFKCLSLILDSHSSCQEIHIWVDAQIVLEWILTGSKTKIQFTKNRIIDIQTLNKEIAKKYNLPIKFHNIEGTQNPADLITRGISAKEFTKEKHTWLAGPQWLNDEHLWPVHELKCLSDCTKQKLTHNLFTTVCNSVPKVEPLVNINIYSNLPTLYRVTANVFIFINKLRKRQSDCMVDAKKYWLKVMQHEDYNKEICYLSQSSGEQTSKSAPPMYVSNLNLVLNQDGLLSCKGRIARADFISNSVKQPILLSKSHHFTRLLVQEAHLRCKHLGVGTTLTCLREQGFWIPRGRQVVKTVLGDCIICKKQNIRAFAYPRITNLPKERISLIKPFKDTGIDYTGHLHVSGEDGSMTKMYIILYTCLSLRCVHLDLVPDMSLKNFLQSFKRFCNTYSIPNSIYTDNAKQFLSSKPYLAEVFKSDGFQQYLETHSIQHRTIPVYSSWVGGVYERQIKTVKQCLYKTVGRAKLKQYELLTVLSDIQNAINNRPLTYVYSDINDVCALTPNMVLKLSTSSQLHFDVNDQSEDPLWDVDPSSLHNQINEILCSATNVL